MSATVDLVHEFGGADAVRATTSMNQVLETTDDPARIAAVLDVLATLGDGWDEPEGGVPIASLRLDFRRSGETLGNIGVGSDFLAAHVLGGFVSRGVDEETVRRLLRSAKFLHLASRR